MKHITRIEEAAVYKFLGHKVIVLVDEEKGAKNVALMIAHFEPQQGVPLHSHVKSEEIYYGVEGSRMVYVGDKRYEIRPNVAIYIPPGTLHKIDLGDEPLTIIAIEAPPERIYDIKKAKRIQ